LHVTSQIHKVLHTCRLDKRVHVQATIQTSRTSLHVTVNTVYKRVYVMFHLNFTV